MAGRLEVKIDATADYTSKTLITGLTPGTEYGFSIGARRGRFKTPSSDTKKVNFVFGSCLGGQGFGRNLADHPDGEGFPIMSAMLNYKPDFFYCNGDWIYADETIHPASPQDYNKDRTSFIPPGMDNLPAAIDLDSFRNRYKYNLEEPQLASFLASTPMWNTADDHEIRNDYGGKKMEQNKEEADIYHAGIQAFFEFWPLQGPPEEPKRLYRSASWGPNVDLFVLDTRSYRAVHVNEDDDDDKPQMAYILGAEQMKWLSEGLQNSKATWKFIGCSIPLSYKTGHMDSDGWSDGNTDTTSGAENEVFTLLEQIHTNQITGVVFLSGDVHHPFCHSYDPFHTGEPLFYEIASTPFQALCLPVTEVDMSFNPTVLYAEGELGGEKYFNFGHVTIDEDGNLAFNVRDKKGASMFELNLPAPSMAN
uniref:PhoD-like phosphatase metallophosphatase domain-containing protein n=1 Tax=Attheya septentrionalis TaxID=420275 RepID=A0A7S2UCQ4_9STRA